MLQFIEGDILQTSDAYIAQGVATELQEGLGTGLALKISKKWPELQKLFKTHARIHGFKQGEIFIAKIQNESPGIIYIATQPDMYQAKITYLNKGIRNLRIACEKNNIKSVSLPRIASGLGKLDWINDVKPLLITHLLNSNTLFNVYETYKSEFEKNGL